MGEDRPELERLREQVEVLLKENQELSSRLVDGAGPVDAGDTEFLQSVLKALPAFVARLDPDLKMRFLNRMAPGYEPEDFLGTSFLEFIDPAHHDRALAAIERVKRSGEVDRFRVEGAGPNKSTAYYETIVAPDKETDGRMGFVLVSFDISEETERAQALAVKEEQLRLAVDATGIGLWKFDLTTGQVEWNERMHEILGRDEPLSLDRYEKEAVHPDDRELVATSGRRINAGDDSAWVRHRILRPDGSVRWIIPTGKVVRDEQGRPLRITGGLLDVTAIRDLEDRLNQAEKMEALGTLTTGVAHNLNNLLAVIRPTLDLLEVHVDEEGHELLEDALKATSRAANVVRQLMLFAGKRRAGRVRVVRLGQLVADAVALSRRSVPSQITLDFADEAPDALVECDPDGLSEVVTNLVLNARDALLDAKTPDARIEVRVEAGQPGSNQPATAAPTDLGERVELTVADNGPGMSETVRQRVFDPFFTTKGPQLGTGLGLAMSWTMVRSLGGTMHCESSPGRGARFSVHLPRAASQEEAVTGTATQSAASPHWRVLVVDDDDAVRRATRLALSRGKHDVCEAATGGEALTMLDERTVDLVLLDQSLPDCRGTDIVDDLRARAGSAKILLFTGQDVDLASTSGLDGLLHKPLGARELLDALTKLGASS